MLQHPQKCPDDQQKVWKRTEDYDIIKPMKATLLCCGRS